MMEQTRRKINMLQILHAKVCLICHWNGLIDYTIENCDFPNIDECSVIYIYNNFISFLVNWSLESFVRLLPARACITILIEKYLYNSLLITFSFIASNWFSVNLLLMKQHRLPKEKRAFHCRRAKFDFAWNFSGFL